MFWLEKTCELDRSHIDAPDPYWLNRTIWYSIQKGASPYPGRPASNPARPWILIEAFGNGEPGACFPSDECFNSMHDFV